MNGNDSNPIDSKRRRVLAGMAGAGTMLLPGCGSSPVPSTDPEPLQTLPAPEDSGIDHIVVVMMENRSFDHFLGWVPGADGRQEGLRFPDQEGMLQKSFPLAPDYQGCQWADPNHRYDGGRVQINEGRMDGWLLTEPTTVGDVFPIGYYTADDLPFYKGVAAEYTVCDRYFSGILASTFPNRMYMHLGQTDRLSNSFEFSTLPSVWQRLRDVGASGRYYFRDLPFALLAGLDNLSISRPYAQFALDAAAGRLPNVSFVDPKFIMDGSLGTSEDDHPQADIRKGQVFLNAIYEALRTSPQWERSLLIINYDEWGGFYDHVEPPFAPVSDAEAALGNDGRLGVRVPCVLLGPKVRRAHVSHHQFDPNSILNLIAWRFGFEPLGARGQTSLNIAQALDFDSPPRTDAPAFNVPDTAPLFTLCDATPASEAEALALGPAAYSRWEHKQEIQTLAALARKHGFAVP